jgi:hypothetical protein
MKQPSGKDWLRLAAQVDWPRQLQRAGVLLRRMRGDAAASIQADHESELQRGEGLHRIVTQAMRQAIGCVAPRPCTCSYCTESPADG